MIPRLSIGALLTVFVSLPLTGQDAKQSETKSSPCVKLIKWPGVEQKTPAICVARNGWYFCILPEKINTSNAPAPELDSGDQLIETKLLQIDPVNRVCLIEQQSNINAEETPVPISSSEECKPGTPLTSMCPNNRCRTTIAGKDQHYLGKELPAPLLRVRVEDASLCQPGTALINSNGELEAILTDGEMAEKKEAHAVPAAVLQKMLTDYQTHHRTGTVWIGAVFQTGTGTLEVLEVRDNSPASKGGIKVGDVILRVKNAEVRDFPSLLEIFQSLPAGKKTKFVVLRGLDEKELNVVPEFVKGK